MSRRPSEELWDETMFFKLHFNALCFCAPTLENLAQLIFHLCFHLVWIFKKLIETNFVIFEIFMKICINSSTRPVNSQDIFCNFPPENRIQSFSCCPKISDGLFWGEIGEYINFRCLEDTFPCSKSHI